VNAESDFERRVRRVLKGLKPGEVATYGEVAEEAGYPRGGRAVGNLLKRSSEGLPWWRVVRADGSLAARHSGEQGELLESEGISVRDARVTKRARIDTRKI
jgi:methylated-DNA-protein-cysteine methyltransferase related protein